MIENFSLFHTVVVWFHVIFAENGDLISNIFGKLTNQPEFFDFLFKFQSSVNPSMPTWGRIYLGNFFAEAWTLHNFTKNLRQIIGGWDFSVISNIQTTPEMKNSI